MIFWLQSNLFLSHIALSSNVKTWEPLIIHAVEKIQPNYLCDKVLHSYRLYSDLLY